MKKGKKVIIVRVAVFLFVGMAAALFFPCPVIGEEMDFIPSVENIDGSLELNMRRIDTRRTSSAGSDDTALFSSIERLRLAADGYIYHPRFIIFRMGGAAGLDQGSYRANGYYSRSNHVFDEYDISVTLLPEHPYNLELFMRRMVAPLSPIFPQSTLATSRGALFRYRQQPFTVYLSAVSQSVEESDAWVDTNQYSAGGSYVIGPVSNAVRYGRGDTVTSQGTKAVRTTSSFSNGLNFKVVTLNSTVGADRQVQTDPAAGSIETDSTEWSERLHADLPLNFSADLQHDYRKDELTTEQKETTFNKTSTNSGTISHMLYKSLRTTYSANESSSQATGGNTESNLQSLSFFYIKNIPIGALNASYSLQNMSFSQTGAAAITNEKHTTAVPGTFILANQADPSTISVLVKDPATQNLVALTVNVNYEVLQFGNTLQITVLNLPAPIVFVPGAPYDFTVSYFLLAIDSKTNVRTNAYNLGFNLFNGLFSPFFGLVTSDVETVSGTVASSDVTTSTTYGSTVRILPFAFFAEYTDYRSRLSPSQSLTTWAEYRQAFIDDTDVLARISNNHTVRPRTETSAEYSENITTMNVTAHKAFAHENLNLFVSGLYSVRNITGISSTSYMFNPSLKWHVGMLDITASVARTHTVSTGTAYTQTYEEDAFYLTVSRKLF